MIDLISVLDYSVVEDQGKTFDDLLDVARIDELTRLKQE